MTASGASTGPSRRRHPYRLTRIWARLLIVVGLIFVGLGFLFGALSLFVEPPVMGVAEKMGFVDRGLVAVFLIFSGLLAGGPFIVFGQLLHIFLDQRALLVRILRELRRKH